MAQKPKKSAANKANKPQHHENALQRFGEEVEERFFEGAELATSTTSAETNAVLAVEGAILGPRTPKPKADKRSNAKPKKVRSKKR